MPPVQFTADVHDAVARGVVNLTFRRWSRPQAKVGGRYRVGAVDVEVDDIDVVPWSSVTAREARRCGFVDREALRKIAAHSGPIDDDTMLYRIEFHTVGAHVAPAPVVVTPDRIAATVQKLDGIDRRSKHGAWTRTVLRLIGERPGTVSTELADLCDRPRPEFKADVRKLKALGLTESLEVGYRLTALGQAITRA